jgi:hypothetical protein
MFQVMTYHDTPIQPLVRMSFRDTTAVNFDQYIYEIRTINTVGLQSDKVKALPNVTGN